MLNKKEEIKGLKLLEHLEFLDYTYEQVVKEYGEEVAKEYDQWIYYNNK